MRAAARVAVRLVLSAGLIAVLLWQIDVRRTAHLVGSSRPGPLVLAFAVYLATTWLLAYRWQLLLAEKGIREPLGWLTKLYFVAYAAGQVLPTAVGGDAVRILEHSRRLPDRRAATAAAVLMERVLGAAGTIVLVAAGLAVAVGRYPNIRVFVWIEAISIVAIVLGLVVLFSARVRTVLERHVFPLGRRIRIERALASVYASLHDYRRAMRMIAAVLGVTVVAQLIRIVSIWLCGEAVGLHLSPLAYIVLGPLLFLVMLIPFTINGLGAREAFFLAFLTRFGVSADAAVATGLLFYAVTIGAAVPGGAILLWQSVRPATPRPSPE